VDKLVVSGSGRDRLCQRPDKLLFSVDDPVVAEALSGTGKGGEFEKHHSGVRIG